jgi:periplasmic divalent cation tolerance protein
MQPSEAVVILCTAPAAGDTAATLARGLVEARLCACVNIFPGLRSFYRWQGAVQDDAEVQLVIKTRRALVGEVEAWIRKNHPYTVPEVLALEVVGGSQPYLDWMAEQTT